MKELLPSTWVVPECPHHGACDGLATRLLDSSHNHTHVTTVGEGRGGVGGEGWGGRGASS